MSRQPQKHWKHPVGEAAAENVHSKLMAAGIPNHMFSVGYDQIDVRISVLFKGHAKDFRAMICSPRDQSRVADGIIKEWMETRETAA